MLGSVATIMAVATDPDTVLRDALALPVEERAQIAAELLASLDEPEPEDLDLVRVAWAEELEHRARRARAGSDPGSPWPELRNRLGGGISG